MLQEKMLQFALGGAEWVLWLLVVLSVLCVAIGLERGIYLVLSAAPRTAFEAAVGGYLKGGSRTDLERALGSMQGLEPRVLLAGFAAGNGGAEDAMAGTLAFEKLRMERGLLFIGTVAANAAYIGLFGTVLGILRAFNDLSLETEEGEAAVMAGIAEALVSTAAGLMVAILAVVLFNFLTRRVKATASRVGSLGSLVLSRMHTES